MWWLENDSITRYPDGTSVPERVKGADKLLRLEDRKSVV
jgi:hypothetical protein